MACRQGCAELHVVLGISTGVGVRSGLMTREWTRAARAGQCWRGMHWLDLQEFSTSGVNTVQMRGTESTAVHAKKNICGSSETELGGVSKGNRHTPAMLAPVNGTSSIRNSFIVGDVDGRVRRRTNAYAEAETKFGAAATSGNRCLLFSFLGKAAKFVQKQHLAFEWTDWLRYTTF